MPPAETRERGPVVCAQGVLHGAGAREPQRLDLTLLDDAAVLADSGTQRAREPGVRARALVVRGVAPERPRRRDQRQDEEDERTDEPESQSERPRRAGSAPEGFLVSRCAGLGYDLSFP